MRVLNINIPVSEEILFVLKKDEKSLQADARKILAMQYFKEKRLSLGKAAELAGMDKDDFTQLLGENRIDIYQYTEKELAQEFEFIDKIVGELKR